MISAISAASIGRSQRVISADDINVDTVGVATPPGQKTYVVRVQRGSRYVNALEHLLADFGFVPVGNTARLRWFLRTDTPGELASRVRDAVEANIALN